MTTNTHLSDNGPLMEELAHLEHDSWARWMRYLFSKCEQHPDGSVTIPATLRQQWDRQAATPYEGLTEQEKESDRKEVRATFPVIEKYFQPK